MKLFTCVGFKGYYPVGTAAVVLAVSKERAKEMLEAELAKLGLSQVLPMDSVVQMSQTTERAVILLDGNY